MMHTPREEVYRWMMVAIKRAKEIEAFRKELRRKAKAGELDDD